MADIEGVFSDLLRKYVANANPSIPHPFDEGRLLDALEFAASEDIEVTPKLISDAWPKQTIEGLGGDPANSTKLFEHTVRLVEEWRKTGTIRGAAR